VWWYVPKPQLHGGPEVSGLQSRLAGAKTQDPILKNNLKIKIVWGKRIKISYMYVFEVSIVKFTKHCLEGGGGKRRE
jgi:hypothetical protein